MYRRDSVHSSFCSARTAPTRRMMASRPGKMPTTSVRRRISLFSRSWGLLVQICRQTSRGKAVKARMSSRAWSRCGRGRELGLERGDDLAVLGPDRGGVGLLEDGADQRGYPRLGGLGHPGEQVAVVVRPAPLPGRAGQDRGDRVHQPGVVVADHQGTPDRPRATRPRRNASHPAPSSELVTSMPRISRYP